LGEWVGQKAG